jgi:DNA-binding NarL/FixJ family response regulator
MTLDAAVSPIRIRALISDDNLLVRHGLRSVLESSNQVKVVGEADTRTEAMARAQRLRPDVIVVGQHAAPVDDEAGAEPASSAGVLVLAHSDDRHLVERAFRAGATSYLVHGQFVAADLIAAVVATAQRQPYLSPGAVATMVESFRSPAAPVATKDRPSGDPRPRQRLSRREAELMEHIVCGRTNREIAGRLFISEKTVKNHVNHIYTKLSARNRAEVIAIWLGLTDQRQPL